MSDAVFDEIMLRLKEYDISISSDPLLALDNNFDNKINTLYGGRGVYFMDPDGHVLEILTADYVID